VGHGHAHAQGLDARRAGNRRRMRLVLAINAALAVAEITGGLVTGSLALIADAGHLLSDLGAVGLGLIAAGLASRPPSGERTFGLQRVEVMAAFLNGVVLVAIAVAVMVLAIGRLDDPPEVEGAGVLAFGVLSLAGNLWAAWVLGGGSREDLNLEGVLRHSLADALASIGVIVAGLAVLTGGAEVVDPIVSLVIALLILLSSWKLIAEPFKVMMESAPSGMDVGALGSRLAEVDGVREVHDLHVWTVTSGFLALSAHVVVTEGSDRDLVRYRVEALLRERYGIEHTTLQVVCEPRQGLIEIR
jgi:cobalt-zinc-cadmium efflux system protein